MEFSDGVNIIVGKNGQGKSNLAEGIYFLNHLDSFRTHRLKKLIQFGQRISLVQGRVAKDGIDTKARIELAAAGRKAWFEDKPVRKLSEYITKFYAIVFNPDSLYFFRHFPGERRAFFDRFLSFHDRLYLQEIRAFRSVHAQKNRLLKEGGKSSLLDWNVLFAGKSCAIVGKRLEVAERINAFLPELCARLTGRDSGLRLEYLPTLVGEPQECTAVLQRAAEREALAGYALYGAHRDDFRLVLADGQRDEFFSQGEYRIALVALKLAINTVMADRIGFQPVLILDDLFSELDDSVKRRLRAYLLELPNQIFITTTEFSEAGNFPDARVMEVREGRIV